MQIKIIESQQITSSICTAKCIIIYIINTVQNGCCRIMLHSFKLEILYDIYMYLDQNLMIKGNNFLYERWS